MGTIRVDLSPDREAHVLMVLEEYAALVRLADQKREQRMAPILAALAIPASVPVRYDRQSNDPSHPAALCYEVPDIMPAPVADGLSEVSEKSTAPASAGESPS